MSRFTEKLGIGSTLLGGFGSGVDAISHNIVTGRADLDIRASISEWYLIGTWLAEHSGNITQSMGPAIAVTLLGETLRDKGKERNSKSLEYLGIFVEIAGITAIVTANIMSEVYYDWPNFLFKNAAQWQEIWQYNEQFNGDLIAGILSIGVGVIAASGVRARFLRLNSECMSI
jgi:hypothetical protein